MKVLNSKPEKPTNTWNGINIFIGNVYIGKITDVSISTTTDFANVYTIVSSTEAKDETD